MKKTILNMAFDGQQSALRTSEYDHVAQQYLLHFF